MFLFRLFLVSSFLEWNSLSLLGKQSFVARGFEHDLISLCIILRVWRERESQTNYAISMDAENTKPIDCLVSRLHINEDVLGLVELKLKFELVKEFFWMTFFFAVCKAILLFFFLVSVSRSLHVSSHLLLARHNKFTINNIPEERERPKRYLLLALSPNSGWALNSSLVFSLVSPFPLFFSSISFFLPFLWNPSRRKKHVNITKLKNMLQSPGLECAFEVQQKR